eukprot:COSAG02_NODE_59516_length_274_cov_0.588571_1_plen_43_part_10
MGNRWAIWPILGDFSHGDYARAAVGRADGLSALTSRPADVFLY